MQMTQTMRPERHTARGQQTTLEHWNAAAGAWDDNELAPWQLLNGQRLMGHCEMPLAVGTR
jgi:hypothetical protein